MTPRVRRVAAALVLLAAGLFAARWLVAFFAERWWADALSPAASLFLARRALVGLGLDLLGTVVAVVWFAVHLRLAVRVAGGIPEPDPGGNPALRRLLRRADAPRWGLGAAVLFGLLVGAGLSRWTDAVMLAGAGVRLGLVEPGLGLDAGTLLAQLPLWLRLHTFATLLVLSAVSLAGLVYLVGGAIRLSRPPRITPAARAHLGVLLAALAVILAASQVLRPYELAGGLPAPVAAGVVQLHRSVGLVLAVACLLVGALSLVWVLRPVHGTVAVSWLVLSAVLVGAHYLVPDNSPAPGDGDATATRRELEAVAYGLAPEPGTPEVAGPPAWWDADVLRQWGELAQGAPQRAVLSVGEEPAGAWLLLAASATARGALSVRAVRDDTLDQDGSPLAIPASAAPEQPGLPRELGPLALRPGAPPRVVGTGPGVRLGGLVRRSVLAWALQAPSLLVEQEDRTVGWYLDPAERLRRVASFAVWGAPRAVLLNDRLVWILDGYVTAEAFPQARRRLWRGREVAYARAGLVGIADAASGQVRIHLRPGHDSLATVWARIAGPLVQPAALLDPDLERALGYPRDILSLQADLLLGDLTAAPDTGRTSLAVHGRPVPGVIPDQWVLPVVSARLGRTVALVVGERRHGVDRLFTIGFDTLGPAPPETLHRGWMRFPFLTLLGDSVQEAGSRWVSGDVRYLFREGGVTAYAPFYAIPSAVGPPRVVAVGVASGERLGVGRTLIEALENQRGVSAGLIGRLGDDAALLQLVRQWARAADSALRRGDLEAFGRAFAALLSVLEGEPRP